MKLLSHETREETDVIGQFSDGSDREERKTMRTYVTVLDDTGTVRGLRFEHEPTIDEIYAAVAPPVAIDLVPTAMPLSAFIEAVKAGTVAAEVAKAPSELVIDEKTGAVENTAEAPVSEPQVADEPVP